MGIPSRFETVCFSAVAPGSRPPDPALAFRVGLAFAPYFAGFLSPHRLVVRAGGLPEGERALWERWYTLSLAEKCFRYGLDVGTRIDCESDQSFKAGSSNPEGGALLMNGGGKDTVVAAELLRRAGIPFGWLSINEKPAQRLLRETFGAASFLRASAGWESLPPLKSFRYHGTAPVLLFYDFVGLLVAEMYGCRDLVVGNEKSADFGNLVYQGVEVNHQYTKSQAFEAVLAGYAREVLGSRVRFYSVLRPFFELQVAEVFSRLTAYHPHFMSCNEGQVGGRREWCGKCSKCAWTYLILAPFLPEAAMAAIFGRNLLEEAGLLPTYLELAGLQGHKPFECVGTPEEALAAVSLWPTGREEPLAVREVRSRVPAKRLAEAAGGLFHYGSPGLIPEELHGPLREAYEALRRPPEQEAGTP